MKRKLFIALAGLYGLLALILAPASSRACGTGTNTITITNLPAIPFSGYQVNGINAVGQLTGFFYVAFQHGAHAFLYDSDILSDLGTLGGGTSTGYAINNSGQIAGQADLEDSGQSHAFLYSGGQVLDLGTLGGFSSTAAALNDTGQVAGSSTLAGQGATNAFLYASGSMTSLGTLGGNYSAASALNNAGTVVGESSVASGDTHGFVYAAGKLTDLGTLGGNYSTALALNGAGMVAGASLIANGATHGFVYAGAALTDVGTLGGSYSSAWLINNNGQVAGSATTLNDEEEHSFIYSAGTLTDLGTLGGSYSYPLSINGRGAVVGVSQVPDGSEDAFLYQQGQLVDLNSLLPANSGWILQGAVLINDSSRIVGYGVLDGSFQWFIMDLVSGDTPPVAVAGPDQTVDCASQITLDGSQSSSANHAPLAFQWSLGATVLGTNVALATSLSLGTNLVTLKVTDPCGASAQTNVVVRVVDSTPPTISCPALNMASADANGQAPVPDVLSQVVVHDNCTPRQLLTLSQDPPAGTLVGPGPHPVNVTVSDPSGNTNTCTTLFTVTDTTPPSIVNVPGPITVSAGANGQGIVPNVLPSVVATDNCTPANQLALGQSPAAGTAMSAGQYDITVTVTDAAGNSSKASVTFKVADTTPPSIVNVPGPITVSAGANGQGIVPNVLPNIVATDNCTPANQLALSQSPAAGTAMSAGQYSITVTVTDAAGNSSMASVAFKVADTTPPLIQSLTVNPSVLSPPNGKPVAVTVTLTASDNSGSAPVSKILSITCSAPTAPADIQLTGDLTAALVASKGPNGTTRIYTITVQSTDASGNSNTQPVIVTVPGK